MPPMVRLLHILILACAGVSATAGAYDFSYSGRLVEASGKPLDGPVALKVGFYHVATGGSPILEATSGLDAVPLQEGTFQFTLSLSASDYQSIFPSVMQPVYVEITDLTHAPGAPYTRQQVHMVPYAARVPVDGKTLAFGADGNMGLAIGAKPGANQFLTTDGQGALSWATPTASVTASDLSAKQDAITPASTVQVGTVATTKQSAIDVRPYSTGAGQTGELRFGELAGNGSHYVGFKAPDALAGSQIWTLPSGDGSAGQLLTTNGAGQLDWSNKVVTVATTLPTCDGTNQGRLVYDTTRFYLAVCVAGEWLAVSERAGRSVRTYSRLQVGGQTQMCFKDSVEGYFCSSRSYSYVNSGMDGGGEYFVAYFVATNRGTIGFDTAVKFVFGNNHSCGYWADGTVKCAGEGSYGALGNGASVDSPSVVTVTGLTDVIDITAGGTRGHSCAVKSDGTVWCWGSDQYGQLGNDAALTDSNLPVQVAGITNATQVASRGDIVCARLASGAAQCWGRNDYGGVGDGTVNSVSPYQQATPVTVTGLTSVTKVVGGFSHSCALLADGTIACWGSNVSGQLGDGTYTNSTVPVLVSGLTNVVDFDVGLEHTCAKTSSGDLYCWGANYYGQIGYGGAWDGRTTPYLIAHLKDVTEFDLARDATCAIARNEVYCWGFEFGLGIGSHGGEGAYLPVPVIR